MRVLVTGGTGFIGNALVKRLLSETDWTIRLLVRDTNKISDLDPERIEVIRGNMRDKNSLKQSVVDVDIVYHLATAMSGTWNDFYQETVVGTEELITSAIASGVERFVYVSSIGIHSVSDQYNNNDCHRIISEDTPVEMLWDSFYTRSKALAEKVVHKHVEQDGFNAVIVRPGVVYGPGGNLLLPRVGYKFGRLLVLAGLNDTPIPTVYIDNLVDALVASANKGQSGNSFNIVDDNPLSKFSYVEHLQRHSHSYYKSFRLPFFLLVIIHNISKRLSRYHSFLLRIHNAFPMMHIFTSTQTISYSNQKSKEFLGWEQRISTHDAVDLTTKSFYKP